MLRSHLNLGLKWMVAASVTAHVVACSEPKATSAPAMQSGAMEIESSSVAGVDPWERGDIVDVAIAAGSFTTLVAAVEKAGLVDVLKSEGPFTVFAPSDEAFAKIPADQLNAILEDRDLLKSILLYHVVAGQYLAKDVLARNSLPTALGLELAVALRDGRAFVNDSAIVATDVQAANGVIHVVDAVILPPRDEVDEQAGVSTGNEVVLADLVDTAVGAGSFSTLVSAVQAAGLEDTLRGEGPFTVFAPTDAAFAKIPQDQLAAILADKDLLTKILLYHVVPGRLLASDVLAACTLTSANGQNLSIRSRDEAAFVNSSQIVATDVLATNGVIHVIDSVLVPELN